MINTQVRLAIIGYGKDCSKKNARLAASAGKFAGKNGISLLAGNVTSTFAFAFQESKKFQVANICVIEKHKQYPKENDATEIYHAEDTYSKHSQIAQMADAALLIGGGSGSQLLINHFKRNKKTVIAIEGSGGLADTIKSSKILKAKTIKQAFDLLYQTKKTHIHTNKLAHLKLSYNHFALTKIEFIDSSEETISTKTKDPFIKQLKSYFKGKQVDFTGRIHLVGTEFQKSVWRAMMDIPYGKTMEFGELAKYLGKEKIDGALGNAALQNPIQIIIPSHRLITKGGHLSNFKGGRELKMRLLDLEKQQTELGIF